ncbi:hypothetical protein, partial [Salmonella enterica]
RSYAPVRARLVREPYRRIRKTSGYAGGYLLRGASQEIPFKLDVYTAQFYFVQDSVVPGEVLWILLL